MDGVAEPKPAAAADGAPQIPGIQLVVVQILGLLAAEARQILGHSPDLIHGERQVVAAAAAAVGEEECLDNGKKC